MLKKEIRDAVNRLRECCLIVAIIPIGYLVALIFYKADWHFIPTMRILFASLALFYSLYAGLTIFMSEKKDHAFEYLFSLPLSRGRILAYKILPRLLILTGIYLAASALMGPVFSQPAEAGLKIGLGIYVYSIFFLSVSLSFVVDSFVAGFFGVLILASLFSQLLTISNLLIAKLLPAVSHLPLSIIIFFVPVLLIFLPMGAVFWIVFRKLDVKPMRLQSKPFYIIVLLMLLLNLAFFYVHHSVIIDLSSSHPTKTGFRKMESEKPMTNGHHRSKAVTPGSRTTGRRGQ
jgi:hypothetical protein